MHPKFVTFAFTHMLAILVMHVILNLFQCIFVAAVECLQTGKMSDADVTRLKFQLLVTMQERDTGYQERDRFQEFYQITSRRAQQLVSRKKAYELEQ